MATASTTYREALRLTTAHKQREGGGFIVRRPIGGAISELDPFLMLDHLGPVEYAPGEAVGAPTHPHRGFSTVTYVLDGGFHHEDSQGNKGDLRPGWVQWMRAGSGVLHSEMPTKELLEEGGRMEGFQLWVNLPSSRKMSPPRYQDTPPEKIPVASTEDGKVTVKVIAGRSLGTDATIETDTPVMMLDVRLKAGCDTFVQDVPKAWNGFAYVYKGKGVMGSNEQLVKEGQVVVLGSKGDHFPMRASDTEDCSLLLIAGEPMNEPIARYGPFVMNTEREIMQAFRDYQSGRFGEIAGAEEEYEATRKAVEAQKKSGRWHRESSEM